MTLKWAVLLILPSIGYAQSHADRFELETGLVATRTMEIRGFKQDNATEDWSKSGPTLRFEYWRTMENDWNYGLVFQPLSLRYRDSLRSDLSAKGKTFRSGDQASLDYQFPTVRFSANKPIFQNEDGSYIRAGGSAVVRYAKVGLSASRQSFSDTNLLVVPLINLEASKPIGSGYSVFARSDFLPGIGGHVFLDGLYDVYFGARKKMGSANDLDVGVRLFFGGYDPKKTDEYANRIFFNALVVRYTF